MTTQRQYIALGGGLDTESPALSVAPGFARESWNFEQAVEGGYRRVAGYERFDGRKAPHTATYAEVPVVETGLVNVGDVLTGDSSGVSGILISKASGVYYLANPTGNYIAGESLRKSGTPVAAVQSGSSLGTDAGILALARDSLRAAIQAVPGSGPVIGVFSFGGQRYAFRNNLAGTAKNLHKATSSGWALVTTPSLPPGGVLDFVEYNFGAGPAVFGCFGIGDPFMFDGSALTVLSPGVGPAKFLAAHQNHLFVSVGASLMHSAIGDPTDWTAINGAGEINVGEIVTGLSPQPGAQGSGALAVATANTLKVLYGTSAANWSMTTLQSEVGAEPRSMQNIGIAFMLSRLGVTMLGQSQEYGNFSHSTISHKLRSWLSSFGGEVTASTIHREKNQYRIFFGNRGLFLTMRGRELVGALPVDYPASITCCHTDSSDSFLFGGNDGFVYQGETGPDFDGVSISSVLVLPFNSSQSLRLRKRYRRLILEIDTPSALEMRADFAFSYGDSDIPGSGRGIKYGNGVEPVWDSDSWDSGSLWGAGPATNPNIDMEGVGENVAITLSHTGRGHETFALRSLILEFSPRRTER